MQNSQSPPDETKNIRVDAETVVNVNIHQTQEVLFRELRTSLVSTDPEIWFNISKWVKATTSINTYWADFSNEIGNQLKGKKSLSLKQRNNMNKLWEMVIRKGFKLTK